MRSTTVRSATRRFLALLVLSASATAAVAQTVAADAVREPSPPQASAATGGRSVASPEAVAMAKAIGRGVNFGNIFDAPREGDWGLRFSLDLVESASKAGFDTVRLPVRWSNHAGATAPYAIDPLFMARVGAAVDALLAQGFHVILNMHHHRQLDGDPLDDDEFAVADEILEERFLLMWRQIAWRFKNHDRRLIFELYNEPHGRLDGEPWNLLAARALQVVRASNPERVVVIGPTHWNNALHLDRLRLPDDPHLIATIHHYEPFDFTHQGAEWVTPKRPLGVRCCDSEQQAKIRGPLELAAAWSARTGYPVFVGEFGAYDKAQDASRHDYTRRVRSDAESLGMSWVYWEYAASFGVYNPNRRRFDRRLLGALMTDD
jgi:endoglucanase